MSAEDNNIYIFLNAQKRHIVIKLLKTTDKEKNPNK